MRSRISRRGLIGSGVAASMLAATGFPLRAQPRQGGRLRMALPGSVQTWDTRQTPDLFMLVAGIGMVFDTLTEVAADGTLKGELATGWQASADARVWTFALREGVAFHNGKPFGPADVVASLKLHKAAGSPAQPIMAQVRSIRALGKTHVQFTLSQPNADFPYLMSDHHLLIYPAGQIAEAMEQGIGTGLYRVEHFVPGQRLQARRVQAHYKDGQAGWFDAIDLSVMNGAPDRIAALQAGRVDVIPDVPPADAARLRSAGVQTFEAAGNGHVAFTMRTDAGPFANPDLRRALKYAVDRPAMLRDVFGGRGSLGADHPVGPLNPFAAGIVPPPYDPDRARYNLRQAGLSSLTLKVAAPEDLGPVVDSYAAAARAAGIRIVADDDGADWLAVQWAGRPTEDWILSAAHGAGSALNIGGWSDARLTALLSAARETLDTGARQALYAQAQQEIADEGNVVIPVFTPFTGAARPTLVRPDQIGALHRLDDARLAERWWSA
ncbi:ABC transporter substrate-binding protein [Anianabacter salinae]|uniref:ABC transporter substrate-binding protein n=1 Tax=Anianabacter salinae TaxID=2851023 RepID=UPI00225DFD17|nr:ABC transporter substrate-binding protein [Anianabacter salinae]MBV0913556.1 ABC transporter substrate-binding protein [Anianabacter salinae]